MTPRAHWIGLLTKLPAFCPEWPDEVAAGWFRCYGRMMVAATELERLERLAAETKKAPAPGQSQRAGE